MTCRRVALKLFNTLNFFMRRLVPSKFKVQKALEETQKWLMAQND